MKPNLTPFFAGLAARLLAALAMAIALAGCASPAKPYDYSAFKEARPKSILVLPPTNVSPDVVAPAGMLARATAPLAEAGYYVLPASLVRETFQQNGITAATDAQAIAPQKLREIFGADAGPYIEITRYGI